MSNPQVATNLIEHYANFPDAIRPRIIELLTQRPVWARALLDAIEKERVAKDAVHVNQVRRLQSADDAEIRARVAKLWGRVREERNREVERAVERVRALWASRAGDANRGIAVFGKTCAQCHQIYGKGEQVGPDITRNGRASFEQLLSNVFDPNLVIGAGYQAHTVVTTDGRTLSGLLVEQSEQRVILKLQGGKVETIPRDQVEQLVASPLSLMPEGWEKQLSEQDLVDLLAYITLDGPPDDPQAQPLPGTPEHR
jgi:putative heme-binding domain-containing protein